MKKIMDALIPIMVALTLLGGFASSARAADESGCIRGLPCIAPYTPNDPWNPEDGPNITGPNKEKSESEACDADFMNQIYGRAFLEAERENIKAEILIRKPDSVLEYSCFETQVNTWANADDSTFTETKFWHEEAQGVPKLVPIGGFLGTTPVPVVPIDVYMGEDKLDKSLEEVVLNTLDIYIKNNFSHSFMGGRSGIDGGGCGVMRDIYFFAKCNDMDVDDKFYTFKDLAKFDPRIYPDACASGKTAITEDHIKLALNEGRKYAYFDSMQYLNPARNLSFIDFMDPRKCLEPVPTGIPAAFEKGARDLFGNVKKKRTEYEEKTCINPGCYYDQPSDKCLPQPD